LANYYGILQVKRDAGDEEIKKSFRNLAKKYHPDKNIDNKEWAEEKTKLIIQAYNILINATSRQAYDIQFKETNNPRKEKKAGKRNESNDISVQVKTVLDDLVNNKGKNAIEKFESLIKNVKGFSLKKYLSGRDFLDFQFLIAEAYEKEERYVLAVEYYYKVYDNVKRHKGDNNNSFFFDETKNRIKTICCKKLSKKSSTKEAIENYKSVLKLHIDNNERAYIYKKISECYFAIGDFHCAVANLNTALTLKPTLKGISKIQTRLNEYFSSLAVG